MSVDSFIPELWNAAIHEPYEKSLVYAQSTIANNNYLGQITQHGDTVHSVRLSARMLKYGAATLAAGALLFVGAFSYGVYSTMTAKSRSSPRMTSSIMGSPCDQ